MKKIGFPPIFIVVFFFSMVFSCVYPEIYQIDLTNDGDNKSNTVLAGLAGNPALMPPSELTYLAELNGTTLNWRLSWDAVPFAVKYAIFLTDEAGSFFTECGSAESNSWTHQETVAVHQIEKTTFFAVQAINSNKSASGYTCILKAEFRKVNSAISAVDTIFISKGTETGVLVTWLPAPGAVRYRIDRARSGGEMITVNNSFIPLNLDDERFSWLDRNIEESLLYDYRVTGFDQYGASGLPGPIAEKGFVWPGAMDFDVSPGSRVRGIEGSTEYSVIDLKWICPAYTMTASGIEDPIFADDWEIMTAVNPSDLNYTALKDIYSSAAGVQEELTCLKLFDPGLADIGVHLVDNLTSDGFTQHSTNSQLFYKSFTSSVDGRIYYQFVYRLLVEDNSFPLIGFTSAWDFLYYFQARAIYNQGSFDEEKTLYSPVMRGFAANPSAVTFDETTYPMVYNLNPDLTVEFTFNAVEQSPGVEVASYRLYRREKRSFNYNLIVETAANSQVQYILKDESASKGMIYEYAGAFIDTSGRRSHFTISAEIAVVE